MFCEAVVQAPSDPLSCPALLCVRGKGSISTGERVGAGRTLRGRVWRAYWAAAEARGGVGKAGCWGLDFTLIVQGRRPGTIMLSGRWASDHNNPSSVISASLLYRKQALFYSPLIVLRLFLFIFILFFYWEAAASFLSLSSFISAARGGLIAVRALALLGMCDQHRALHLSFLARPAHPEISCRTIRI